MTNEIEWQGIAARIRRELRRRSQALSEMSLEEISDFICCCDEARDSEIGAFSYESQLTKAQSMFGD